GTREWVGLKLPKPVVSLTFTNKHLKFWHDPFVCSTIVYHKPVKIFSILNHFPINYHSQMITYIITLLINTYTIMDHILPYLIYIHTHCKIHSGSSNVSHACIPCYTQYGIYI